MRKVKYFIVSLLAMVLTSCGKFSDGSSVWTNGLWIAPIVTTAGFLFFGYDAYIQAIKRKEFKIWEMGSTYFAVGCFIATLLIIFGVNIAK